MYNCQEEIIFREEKRKKKEYVQIYDGGSLYSYKY